MSSILKQALALVIGDQSQIDMSRVPRNRPLKQVTERDLIRLESKIGAELFGPLPADRRREFFCLDSTTWIWYEEWTDERNKLRSTTIRYEINQNGILKVQEGARYSYLEGKEYEHFVVAVQMYYERTLREIYERDPDTGQPLQAMVY